MTRARKALEETRAEAVEALRQTRYFVKQADWLQERFPDAVLRDVEGLVKRVDRDDDRGSRLELDPRSVRRSRAGRRDEDFDFEEALRAIHIDLKGLNEDAAQLASGSPRTLKSLGA